MSRAGRIAEILNRFGPPLALMAVIFALSAQPDLGTGLGTLDLIGRKLIHMTEYGLLFVLWLRAFRWRAPWAAAVIALAYAATDEFHQTFVTGRHGTPVDVAIDAAGIAVAALLTRRFARGSARLRRTQGASPASGRRATEDARRRAEAPRS